MLKKIDILMKIPFSLRFILFSTFFITLVRSMSLPFIAVYLLGTIKLSPDQVGLMLGIATVIGVTSGTVGGSVSDKVGRKATLVISIAGMATSCAAIYLVKNPFLLLPFLGTLFACNAFYEPTSRALIADSIDEKQRVHVFSLRYVVHNVGWVLGPLFGLYAGVTGEPTAFLFSSIGLTIIAFAFFYLLPSYPNKKNISVKLLTEAGRSLNAIRTDIRLLMLIIATILTMTVHGQMTVNLSMYISSSFENGTKLFAMIILMNPATVILCQPLVSRIQKKYKPLIIVSTGCIFLASGMILFYLSQNLFHFSFSMVLFTIGEIFIMPAEFQMVDKISPQNSRGTYFGAHHLGETGQFFGLWIGGLTLTHFGGGTMFMTFSIIALIAIFFYWKHTHYIASNQVNK